jgi:hypothetical protein
MRVVHRNIWITNLSLKRNRLHSPVGQKQICYICHTLDNLIQIFYFPTLRTPTTHVFKYCQSNHWIKCRELANSAQFMCISICRVYHLNLGSMSYLHRNLLWVAADARIRHYSHLLPFIVFWYISVCHHEQSPIRQSLKLPEASLKC